MQHRIPVFYVPEMIGKPSGTISPSATKPAEVVADWLADPHIAERIEVVEFDSISRDTIAQVHDPKYVADVLSRRTNNGFGERSKSVADSLPFTSGSVLAAAQHVLSRTEDWAAHSRIACSPSSGFHHAHYGYGHGFCTFNGLMVTAVELKRRQLVDRVLVLDCDQHYGDGTQDIIERLGLDWVTHVTHGGRLPGSYADKESMLDLIARHVPTFAGKRSLVLYQAGADCHVDDPLGGFLTTEDMRERDRLVFSLAVKHRVPLVWNLAGGYQRDDDGSIVPVLKLHRNTMKAAVDATALELTFPVTAYTLTTACRLALKFGVARFRVEPRHGRLTFIVAADIPPGLVCQLEMLDEHV
jgi:acetoin utilization deacetylase AcuC-like enzyme